MLSLLLEYKHINMTNEPRTTEHFLLPREETLKDVPTFEHCMSEARKFSTIKDWRKYSRRSYTFAYDNGFHSDCCQHMASMQKQKLITSKTRPTGDECYLAAKEFKTRSEWAKQSPNTYRHACRKGIINKCVSHMSDNEFPAKRTFIRGKRKGS
ncbi:hypothetical protein C9J27_05735 [Photobacterium kishitanii]|uniref:Uncharacterized protein n=1 Tax=Photobacterium kishitanii TaxID=318456 RepID=A0A2T3KLR7_9GAMM|nr:hypothetical protein C9J27_05735 [Photobacterium kishitanii]